MSKADLIRKRRLDILDHFREAILVKDDEYSDMMFSALVGLQNELRKKPKSSLSEENIRAANFQKMRETLYDPNLPRIVGKGSLF